jgi:hypothetical protein
VTTNKRGGYERWGFVEYGIEKKALKQADAQCPIRDEAPESMPAFLLHECG